MKLSHLISRGFTRVGLRLGLVRLLPKSPGKNKKNTVRMRDMRTARMLADAESLPGTVRWKTVLEQRIIRRHCSFLFDTEWYLATNPDVHDYAGGAFNHFCRYGWREGRSPHPLFNISHYRSAAGALSGLMNPLVHYQLIGRRDEISPSRWFDVDVYLSCNPDVAISKMDPYAHFVRFGVQENRTSSSQFDPKFYLSQLDGSDTPELPALLHYLGQGRAEGRVILAHAEVDETPFRLVEKPVRKSQTSMSNALNDILALEPRQNESAKVDVIIPVFRDYHITMACLRTVLLAANDTPFEVVVVNDMSPEPKISRALTKIAEKGLIKLVSHERNEGFVRSVNTGIASHKDRDVILLNSDTEVFGNWIDRLRRTAYAKPTIATVTPLTNSGTICSYPRFVRDNGLPMDVSMAGLDAMASKANHGEYVEAPTAVGFCMYIKRRAIDDVGTFDAARVRHGLRRGKRFLSARPVPWMDRHDCDRYRCPSRR